MSTFMQCNHTAQGVTEEGDPVCLICFPSSASQKKVDSPDLTGRVAECGYCKKETASRVDLAFFEYAQGNPSFEKCSTCSRNKFGHSFREKGHEFVPSGTYSRDKYYCGCRGWD